MSSEQRVRRVTIPVTIEIPIDVNSIWDTDATGINALVQSVFQPALSGYQSEGFRLERRSFDEETAELMSVYYERRRRIMYSATVNGEPLLPQLPQSPAQVVQPAPTSETPGDKA